MFISLIAALTPDYVIGNKNQLPWPPMPKDWAHFKKLTLHKPVVMGRKTYQSLEKALPNRKNIVITRDKNFLLVDADVFSSLEEALVSLKNYPEVCIIGGGEIYTLALPFAHCMHLTFIEADCKGDAYFPQWKANEWKEVSREHHTKDNKNPYNYSFVTFERINI